MLLLSQGFPTRGKFFVVGILWLLGEIEIRVLGSDCWNIDVLADLADVIPIII